MAIIECAGSFVADGLVSRGLSLFKEKVVERWSRRRAEEFMRTFCATICDGEDTEGIAAQLNELMADDQKSEALFDAYRRVALSRSKEIGPRIIALVVARIIAEEREPTYDEESIQFVAESLSDSELVDCKVFYFMYVAPLPETKIGTRDDVWSEDESASPNMNVYWGTWSSKLQDCGMIELDIRLVNPPEPDFDESPREHALATNVRYRPSFGALADVIKLASQPSQSESD